MPLLGTQPNNLRLWAIRNSDRTAHPLEVDGLVN